MKGQKGDGEKHTHRKGSRPTIGLLTRPLGDKLRALRWLGVADAARERGANLICYPGGVLHEPKISDNSQKTGRVVISVCVDKTGRVIKATYTQKGSTTTDSELQRIAREAALQFKFTTSDIEEQCGTITVDFKLKG